MAYTPGVARVCDAIAEDRDKAFEYTIKRNTVAVVSDGTAVLGLGDIGPRGRDAGDGGQGDAVQGVRRRRRLPDLPRHQGPRRDRRHGRAASPPPSAASTSRTSPPRAASRSRTGSRSRSTSPSSTTTSTAPRSSCSRRCSTRCKLTGKRLEDLQVLVIGLGAAGVAVTKILLEAGVRDDRRLRLPRRAAHRALRLRRRLDVPDQALVRRAHEPRAARRAARRRDRRHGPGRSACRARASSRAEALRRMNARRDGLRDGQPQPRGLARGGRARTCGSWPPAARTTRTRSTTCSLPGHLPRRARRARALDHRGDEDGRRPGDRRDRRPRTSCARTTSSPRSSTATSPPPSPRRSP